MPLYEAECLDCEAIQDFFSTMNRRHLTPECQECGGATRLVISAVVGVVRFPAAGGQEYISPVSGRKITTERARRDDLARTDCRPYEGFEQETKEAKRRIAEDEKKSDEKLEVAVRKAYHQLPPEKRRHLGG